MHTTHYSWATVGTRPHPIVNCRPKAIEGISLHPQLAGHVLLGRLDVWLNEERRRARAGGPRRRDVVFDARLWDDAGRVQWYGDIDLAARGPELQHLADVIGGPLYLVEYSGPPYDWPDTDYYRRKPVWTFQPQTTALGHPIAHLSRLDVRARRAQPHAPVWWSPFARAQQPVCFMDFAHRSRQAVAAAAATRAHLRQRHPAMKTTIDVLVEIIAGAIHRDGWRHVSVDAPSEETICMYVEYAMVDVIDALERLWARDAMSAHPAIPTARR